VDTSLAIGVASLVLAIAALGIAANEARIRRARNQREDVADVLAETVEVHPSTTSRAGWSAKVTISNRSLAVAYGCEAWIADEVGQEMTNRSGSLRPNRPLNPGEEAFLLPSFRVPPTGDLVLFLAWRDTYGRHVRAMRLDPSSDGSFIPTDIRDLGAVSELA
jgi:hypothetical protein